MIWRSYFGWAVDPGIGKKREIWNIVLKLEDKSWCLIFSCGVCKSSVCTVEEGSGPDDLYVLSTSDHSLGSRPTPSSMRLPLYFKASINRDGCQYAGIPAYFWLSDVSREAHCQRYKDSNFVVAWLKGRYATIRNECYEGWIYKSKSYERRIAWLAKVFEYSPTNSRD